MTHILLIEDDIQTAESLLKGLGECRHVLDHAADGGGGQHLALSGRYEVLVIDHMLPGSDALSIIRVLRAHGNQAPALVLSALGDVDDRVAGWRAGGDYYLVKPYAFTELLARLEALSRHNHSGMLEQRLRVGDLIIDRQSQTVRRANKRIRLQPREFRLLEYLIRNAGRVVTRTTLLENVWELHFDPQTNVSDVQIGRLRSKIDKGFRVPLLHTVRGAGYKLSESP